MQIVELELRVRFRRGKLGGVQILGSGVSRLGISVLILGSLVVSFGVELDPINLLSGIKVKAQPPPPAPVSFVANLNGSEPVEATIISKEGCETPSVTRWA
jgi:hypothetical protein